MRILHAVEIEQRAVEPLGFDRLHQFGQIPAGDFPRQDRDPLMVDRPRQPLKVFGGYDLKAAPLFRTEIEQLHELPAPLLGEVNADDVLRPSGEERLAGTQSVKLLLGFVLMPHLLARRHWSGRQRGRRLAMLRLEWRLQGLEWRLRRLAWRLHWVQSTLPALRLPAGHRECRCGRAFAAGKCPVGVVSESTPHCSNQWILSRSSRIVTPAFHQGG